MKVHKPPPPLKWHNCFWQRSVHCKVTHPKSSTRKSSLLLLLSLACVYSLDLKRVVVQPLLGREVELYDGSLTFWSTVESLVADDVVCWLLVRITFTCSAFT